MKFCLAVLTTMLSFLFPALAQDKAATISSKIANATKIDGYIPLYWDANAGKMWMEISRLNQEFLYSTSLPAGIGSNPIGLDRGRLGGTYVVYFERVAGKVLMIQPNYQFRALSNDAAEKRAVADSFAKSVIWGFKVEAVEGQKILVDATSFFMRDGFGVGESLRMVRQGNFRFDETRSAFYLPRTKGFPKNTEVETMVTMASEDPGGMLRGVTPTPNSVTVREHYSFVELPDNAYKPRQFDPRVNAMPMTFYDFASPFDTPVEKRWIRRHRLVKKDPSAAVSEPVKPIVYYVDNGAPEPIRSALVEGASWWAQAFEAAGYRNAFIVKVLPEDADPMDIRYNMINWVHRSTRGWSYGSAVSDPRTGEIIKGNVTLGSLRIRQDVLLGTGMIPPETAMGDYECLASFSPDIDYLADAAMADLSSDSGAMALARIRQLAAHEVGHTLGFSHNFAASTNNRASVLDYPAPYVKITNGKLDLSEAYAAGIGAYDKYAVTFAYGDFGADEPAELKKFVAKGDADGMLFIDDSDARGVSTAHPLASVWDNGSDAIAMLRHEMEVRKIGLRDFGLKSISDGQPLSTLDAKLLPLFLHHRYQLIAASKSLGGLYFTYAVKTGGIASPTKVREIVTPGRQREALKALLDTIKVEELVLPQRILDLIPPTATGFNGGTAEYFGRRTEPSFDALGAATIAVDLSLQAILDPARASRLVDFHAQNAANPGLKEVVETLLDSVFKPTVSGEYHRALQRTVQFETVKKLIDLAGDESVSPLVRSEVAGCLRSLSVQLKVPAGDTHKASLRGEIERFFSRPDPVRTQARPLPAPAGDPIGN